MIRQSDGVSLPALITPENVIFLAGKPTKEETVRQLTERILPQVSGRLTRKTLFDRVAEVEKLNPVLESGFYIPHAKFPELDGFHAVLGIIPEGFVDPVTGLTVKAALLLLSPTSRPSSSGISTCFRSSPRPSSPSSWKSWPLLKTRPPSPP